MKLFVVLARLCLIVTILLIFAFFYCFIRDLNTNTLEINTLISSILLLTIFILSTPLWVLLPHHLDKLVALHGICSLVVLNFFVDFDVSRALVVYRHIGLLWNCIVPIFCSFYRDEEEG